MADDVDIADRQLTMVTESDETAAIDSTVPLDDDDVTEDVPAPKTGSVRWAILVGVLAIAALAALTAWFGVKAYQANEIAARQALFLSVGRQGALNLTTIRAPQVDADIQRILDSSTGAFHEDFQKRSDPFRAVVKQTQASSEGTITEAGVESATDDAAQVLVSVAVKTTTPGSPAEQQPRLWRMRLTVEQADGGAKVSDVKFVP